MIRIQTIDFSVEHEISILIQGQTKVGGVVSFVGKVRDFSAGDDVVAMELEHYPGMTEAELAKIEATARLRFEVEFILVVHRVGRLAVSDNIVLVVAASQHRAQAFAACQFVIDHLKVSATFWKKEILRSGEGRWVNSCPGCEAAASQWEDLRHIDHTHKHHDGQSGTGGHPHKQPSGKNLEPNQAGGGQVVWSGLRVGILTLSDSRNLSTDKSGDALETIVLDMGAKVVNRLVLPDVRAQIRDVLIQWADVSHMDVILTTGGTGPSLRDVTPEATRDVCDRELPGFAEVIRMAGLEQVRAAILTRGVSAFRGKTLVVNLPGSTRGAIHSLKAVADMIPHALRMAKGEGHG